MQQLFFEAAWDRTISDQDRRSIIEIFESKDHAKGEGLESTYVTHATNHRGELLYTVMLHNYQDSVYSFYNKPVTIQDQTGHSMTETFTLPVEIPAHSSMPWTFIFSSSEADTVHVSETSLIL